MGKNSKSKKADNSNDNRGEDRFVAAETRPQFKVPKASASKVVLDERFSSVLTDSRFQLQEKDKYGRKKKKRNRESAKEDLESFYVVENPEENNDQDDKKKNEKEKSTSSESDSESESESENPTDEKATDHKSRIAYLTALSRGEINDSSSSEDDESSESSDDDDDSDGEDSVYGTAGVLDPSTKQAEEDEIEITYDTSPYLVVTNMDWENIRAIDLFSILSSFAPPGAVKKVQVFQSDFGMEQMAKDKLYGPTGIWQKPKKSKKKSLLEERSDSEEEDSDDEDSGSEEESMNDIKLNIEQETNESDYDPEKLRAYEASKLKYYFAVTEVSNPDYADIIYREVDGMEFEHSSTAIDLRTLPIEALESVVKDRPMRDEATSIPAKYEPPDFVVSALQQSNVKCTWDQGDKEREKKLTGYGGSNWQESFEQDDLKAYIASDASSEEESDSDDEKVDKKSAMRKALGLDSDSGSDKGSDDDSKSDDDSDSDSGHESDEDGAMSKQMTYVPGKTDLEERIRSKLESKGEETTKELTPWEKYQEKRKQKRKERRQAARGGKNVDTSRKESDQKKSRSKDRDEFFASDGEGDGDANFESAVQKKNLKNERISKEQKAKEQLELLLAGEHAEEEARDYDIRGIQRMEKNKGKKLKGSRKRKEAKKAADVSGSNFKINVDDDRFKAVLDGSDGRFGIDKTDPNFKDTTAMRNILSEQTKRRKNKRQKKAHNSQNAVVTNENGSKANTSGKGASGASALSFLVQKLKSQVDKPKN